MRNVWIGLSLFVVQLVLTFKGSAWLGKYLNPVVLFSISMALPVLFLRQRLDTGSNPPVSKPSGYRPWIGAGLGLLAMLLCYEELRKLFVQFAVPRDYSDVIPQLEMLYIRFRDGIFPYAPVDMGSYQPYPVYMPMHWLPVFFADKFHVDSRWIGYGILALAHAGFGFALARKHTISVRTIIAILLPSLALWAFILWGTLDIPISYELVIAAYYLVLAFGLYTRNTVVIALGLVLCLLSRYTLVFWIPLFAVLLWWNKPWKTSVAVWGAAAAAFILLYLLPFYAKDPSILTKGVTYHLFVGNWLHHLLS